MYVQKQDNGNVAVASIRHDETWVKFTLPDGEVDESNLTWIDTPLPVVDSLKVSAKLETSITAKADSIILEAYSELKQRKLMSIAIALQDKVINGGTLTADEEALLQVNRDANAWITGIRTIENTAISDSTPLGDIVWTVLSWTA